MIWHIIQSSATMNIMYTKHNVHKNATLIVTTVTENYNTHCKISTVCIMLAQSTKNLSDSKN